tara:strand:+ start:37 stop:999 length:963 start_codon:yes stop_codon:yes gene_type:complete
MENKQDLDKGFVTGEDLDGNEVTVFVKKPTTKEYRESQAEYNRAFRAALESGAVLKKKLNQYMRDQGLWDDEKDAQEQALLDKVSESEKALKKGGIPLSEAKELALDLRKTRAKFRSLIAERTVLDANTVEGQADNARFNSLVTLCVMKEDQTTPLFNTLEEYEKADVHPYITKAASTLANFMYDLDPNYDKNLTENKFLKTYKFANEEDELVNADGHTVAIDDEGVERLINEDGRYIAYRTDEGYKNQDPEQAYFVNSDGEEIDKDGELVADFLPFLDDSGKPVEVPKTEATEEVAEDTEIKEEAPKKRGRPKKTEEIA